MPRKITHRAKRAAAATRLKGPADITQCDVTARVCLFCGQAGSWTLRDLEQHVHAEHGASMPIYQCRNCPEPFTSPASRNIHQEHCPNKPLRRR